MSEPYIGEIRIFPYARGAPLNWQLCDGTLLSIAEYDALFALIGTTYGGDGQTTFAVPDLRGRVPIHQGRGPGLSTYVLGQKSGTDTVTLTVPQLPQHTHLALASTTAASTNSPAGAFPAAGISTDDPFYGPSAANATAFPLAPSTLQPSGQGLPHENCAPTQALNYCIALFGIFPSQS